MVTFKTGLTYSEQQVLEILNKADTVNNAARLIGVSKTDIIRNKIKGFPALEEAYKKCQGRGFQKRLNSLDQAKAIA